MSILLGISKFGTAHTAWALPLWPALIIDTEVLRHKAVNLIVVGNSIEGVDQDGSRHKAKLLCHRRIK